MSLFKTPRWHLKGLRRLYALGSVIYDPDHMFWAKGQFGGEMLIIINVCQNDFVLLPLIAKNNCLT